LSLQEEAREEIKEEAMLIAAKVPSKNSTAVNDTLGGATPGGVGAGGEEQRRELGGTDGLLEAEARKQDPLLSSLVNEQELRMEVRSLSRFKIGFQVRFWGFKSECGERRRRDLGRCRSRVEAVLMSKARSRA
jgi:hypothetical protein